MSLSQFEKHAIYQQYLRLEAELVKRFSEHFQAALVEIKETDDPLAVVQEAIEFSRELRDWFYSLEPTLPKLD